MSTFTPWAPILPIASGLDAVIPPTWVPFLLEPATVTKYDKTSVFASHDIISVWGGASSPARIAVVGNAAVRLAELGKSLPGIRSDEKSNAGKDRFSHVNRLLPRVDEHLIRILISAVGWKRMLHQRGPRGIHGQARWLRRGVIFAGRENHFV